MSKLNKILKNKLDFIDGIYVKETEIQTTKIIQKFYQNDLFLIIKIMTIKIQY